MDENDEYRKGRALAMECLSRKGYLSTQLKETLIERGVPSEVAESTVCACRDLGYLDDDAWVQSYVRRQVQRRDGPRKIMAKLRDKGVAAEQAKEAIEAISNRETQVEAIRLLLNTRYRSRNLRDYQERQKVAAALARKGFTFDTINEALSMSCLEKTM